LKALAGEHDSSGLPILPLLDANHYALAVDVVRLERNGFGHAQARGAATSKDGAVHAFRHPTDPLLLCRAFHNRQIFITMHPALKFVDHRPWPLPAGPWIMEQTWNDLLFAHWPVSAGILRSLVPSVLSLDTFNGQSWVAVTPFRMSGVRLRSMPSLPCVSAFPELNVRTYVRHLDKPGVYFFSLDAGSRLAAWAARASYHLPYRQAQMSVAQRNGWFEYHAKRNRDAELHLRYRAVRPAQLRAAGTLEHWLTERYCLYTLVRNTLYRAEIHHRQWALQDAEAEIRTNSMAQAAGVTLPEIQPLLCFSRRLEVLTWPLKRA